MKNKPILFDTCVFITHLRSSVPNNATLWIEDVIRGDIDGIISPLIDYELWRGVKDNSDAKRHKILLARFRRVDFHVTIARRAGQLNYPFIKNHDRSISGPDFILAATAEYYGANILTDNLSDFSRIPIKESKIFSWFDRNK